MQKLQLSIPEPCHENWQQMTPTEQGRYCNACAKEVVVLTKESIEHFQTDTRWVSWVYYSGVFDKNNRPVSKTSFLIQY